MNSNLQTALHEFKNAIGETNVKYDSNTLTSYQTTTFDTNHTIPAVISPGTRDEVQECLRIANNYKTPIYP
ncbi:MAG: FAD-binding oxidoreductase, partial [Gammaproteobacteria bacterium]